MAVLKLCEEEKHFLRTGINQDFRNDGRGCNDYRATVIETGVIPAASGSARVRVSGTHVTVGVKAEIGEPSPNFPNSGQVEFFVDCSANASPIFEGRGGDDLAAELSNALKRTFCKGSLDGATLCVIPGKVCWVLYIDTIVLECGGNLFDVLSIAVKAALYNTRIPKLRIIGEGSELDYEVPDDLYESVAIDISNVPVIITLNKVGDRFIVDASAEEESCSDAQLLLSVNQSGKICSIQKHGKCGINPELLFDMMQVGQVIGTEMNDKLMAALKRESETYHTDQKVGFKR